MAGGRLGSPSSSHDSGTKGRTAELYLGTLLLNYGFEVFQPLVDVSVDYLAYNQKRVLLRLQSKSRSRPDGTVFDLSPAKSKKVEPPTHVFYVRGAIPSTDYWLVPYAVVRRVARKLKRKRGRGTLRIIMSKDMQRKLRDYYREDGFEAALAWK